MIIIEGIGEFEAADASEIESGQINSVAYIAQKKTFSIRDAENILSTFNGGILQQWRGRLLSEVQNGVTVFAGTIQAVRQSDDQFIIDAEEPLVTYLNFAVDTTVLDTSWELALDTAQGNTAAQITGGAGTLPKYTRIIFEGSENEYLLLSHEDETITFDPPLKNNVESGATIYAYKPARKTASAALKSAFEAVGLSARIGSSFDYYTNIDAAADRLLFFNIRPIDNYPLKDFLGKTCEMAAFDFYTSRDGKIEIKRYGSSATLREFDLTGAEIMRPVEQSYDTTALFYRYDLFYIDSNDLVGLVQNEVNESIILQWDNDKAFRPVPNTGILSQKIIYVGEECARFFGELVLSQYSVAPVVITCPVKQSDHTSKRPLNINLFDEFFLLHNVANRRMQVKAFNYNRRLQRYQSVTFSEVR